jgi:dienelactone hydrolase
VPDVTVGPTSGYLAVPAGSPGPWPGVVVIHEIFGVNRDVRAHADRLAALGYLRRISAFFGEHLREVPASDGPADGGPASGGPA